MRTPFLCLLLLLCVAISWASPVVAVVPGTGGTQNHNYIGNVTFGYQFTAIVPFVVVQLGYFDAGGDGLSDSHPVALFNSAGTILVSATVPAGTAGTLTNGFRYASIAPTPLTTGTYTIGGYANGTSLDDFLFGMTGSTTVPQITLGTAVSTIPGSSSSLSFPNNPVGFATQGYFGPNFVLDVAAVPEPGTWAFLMLGLSVLAFVGKRLKKASL